MREVPRFLRSTNSPTTSSIRAASSTLSMVSRLIKMTSSSNKDKVFQVKSRRNKNSDDGYRSLPPVAGSEIQTVPFGIQKCVAISPKPDVTKRRPLARSNKRHAFHFLFIPVPDYTDLFIPIAWHGRTYGND